MPIPVLQAMVLADHVYQDKMTGKHIIAGTFANILLVDTPFEASRTPESPERRVAKGTMVSNAGSPYLYFALTEVHGCVPLSLKFVDLSNAKLLFEAHIEVTAKDPVVVAEYIVALPPLPVARAGAYSLDLLYEEEMLGSWRVTAKKFDHPPTQSQDDAQ